MLLEGPSIKNQMAETTSPTALAIAQIIKFNRVKHKRGPGTGFVRHSTTQEIPVPLCVGLMLQLSTQMGNNVCKHHQKWYALHSCTVRCSLTIFRVRPQLGTFSMALQFLYSSIPPMLGKRLTEDILYSVRENIPRPLTACQSITQRFRL